MTNQIINGKPLHKVGVFQVWQTDTNNYIVTGGAYNLFFENMPTVDELTFKSLIKPANKLNGYERMQLEKRGNVLVSKNGYRENSNVFDSLLQNHIELQELSTQGY